MSFIELTKCGTEGKGVTINTAHILTISTEVEKDTYPAGSGRPNKGEVYTDITLAGGSQYAPSRVMVTESYEEIRRLLGLGPFRCGEGSYGAICDRPLDSEGRCPVHGKVGP